MVTGRVAALLLVENPSNCAGAIPLKKNLGVFFVNTYTKKAYTNIINANPKTTQNAYQPRALNKSVLGDSTTKAANKAKTP